MTGTDGAPAAGRAPTADGSPTVEEPRGPGPDRTPTDDGAAHRAVRRTFRPRRAIPAAIVATILAVLPILVAAEVISRLFDRPLQVLPVDDLARLGRETQWNDPLTLTVAGITVGTGLLLLLLALWPGRARAIAVASHRDQMVMAVTAGGVAHIAEQAAETVDGVARAQASARPGQIRVRADSPLREAADLADQVHRAVTDAVTQLAPVRAPKVRVAVRHRGESS